MALVETKIQSRSISKRRSWEGTKFPELEGIDQAEAEGNKWSWDNRTESEDGGGGSRPMTQLYELRVLKVPLLGEIVIKKTPVHLFDKDLVDKAVKAGIPRERFTSNPDFRVVIRERAKES